MNPFVSNVSSISFVLVTNFAPCFINEFGPVPYALLIPCGMQNTSFPCSNPYFPVIVVPLLPFPSITIIPSDSPLTILFLCGKVLGFGGISGGYSVITVPPVFKMSLYN